MGTYKQSRPEWAAAPEGYARDQGTGELFPVEAADLYEVAVDRDYGNDESFMVDTEQEARTLFSSYCNAPDVRRVWLFGPGVEDAWVL